MYNHKAFVFFGCFLLVMTQQGYAKKMKPIGRIITDCAACHGKDGNSANDKACPKLAGQNANYLIKELKDFQPGANHGRYNPIMNSLAAALSEKERIKVANYYASLLGDTDAVEVTLLPLGQRLYRGGDFRKGIPACLACHGPAGLGNPPAGFPRLSGQHAAYIAAQLKVFRAGKRNNDKYRMMGTITEKMNDADITAVASYISGLYC